MAFHETVTSICRNGVVEQLTVTLLGGVTYCTITKGQGLCVRLKLPAGRTAEDALSSIPSIHPFIETGTTQAQSQTGSAVTGQRLNVTPLEPTSSPAGNESHKPAHKRIATRSDGAASDKRTRKTGRSHDTAQLTTNCGMIPTTLGVIRNEKGSSVGTRDERGTPQAVDCPLRGTPRAAMARTRDVFKTTGTQRSGAADQNRAPSFIGTATTTHSQDTCTLGKNTDIHREPSVRRRPWL